MSNDRFGPVALGILSVCVLFAAEAMASGSPPPPPQPPTGLAEAYYVTCGTSHPPFQALRPTVSPGDPGYDELVRFAESDEYQRWVSEVQEWLRDHQEEQATGGRARRRERQRSRRQQQRREEPPADVEQTDNSEVLQQMREAIREEEARRAANQSTDTNQGTQGTRTRGRRGTPKMGIDKPTSFAGYSMEKDKINGATTFDGSSQQGRSGGRVNRNPRQDLATWFRGFLYHQDVNPMDYDNTPEAATHLDAPVAGPCLSTNYYHLLVDALQLKKGERAPAPNKLVDSVGAFWQSHWRKNLGFSDDPSGRKLSATHKKALEAVVASRKRFRELKNEADKDRLAAMRLRTQLLAVAREAEAAARKESELRGRVLRRQHFIRAITSLLRLAPEGGFGPTFHECNQSAVQKAAHDILADVGVLAGHALWNGLVTDLTWLADPAHKSKTTATAPRRGKKPVVSPEAMREKAVKAATEALSDTRIPAQPALCGFLLDPSSRLPSVLNKAMDLLEQPAEGLMTPRLLAALPRLADYAHDSNAELAARAERLIIKLLGAPKAHAADIEVVGNLAGLLKDKNTKIVEAVEGFLKRHTGKDLGKDPAAWRKAYDKAK